MNGSGAFAISLAIQAEAEIELLRQPFSGLMYVGGIAGFKTDEKLLESWDITTLSALAWMMILQHIEIM